MRRYGKVRDFEGRVEGKRVIWEREGELVYMEPYGNNAIRFRSSASLHIDTEKNWTLLDIPVNGEAEVSVERDRAVIVNGKAKATLLGDGTVFFENSQTGKVLLCEEWLDKRNGTAPQRDARVYQHISSNAYKTDLFFLSDPKEHFYGMGQEPNDCMDLKGATVELFQKNTKCTIPYLLSSKGYGFIWNNPSIGQADLTKNHTKWHSEACSQIDYILIVGSEKLKRDSLLYVHQL